MKKTLTILVVSIIAMLALGTTVKATTQAELEEYLTTKHTVAGKEVSLTSLEIKQVKDYFASHTMTDEQATYIKERADECLDILDRAGVIDVQKLSKENKKTLILKAKDAAEKVGLTVDTTTGIVRDPATGEELFVLPEGKLVQTGTNNAPYIIIAGIAIVAVAGIVGFKVANRRNKE